LSFRPTEQGEGADKSLDNPLMLPCIGLMRAYCVYLLSNRSGTLYLGVTSNLQNRLEQHRSKSTPSFSARYNLWKLVWFEVHETASQAIQREKQIKKWRREKKLRLIISGNPKLQDLAQKLASS
jgi:putative endonuclease